MASASASSDSQRLIPSILLQLSKRWTLKHLQVLKVIQQFNLPAEALIGAVHLPGDKD
jgi:hypothetical protein